jgi:hypothetical protein
VLERLATVETPTTKREALGKLQGILDIANGAGDRILQRTQHFPDIKFPVRCRATEKALARVIKALADFPELDTLESRINHLKANLKRLEQLR